MTSYAALLPDSESVSSAWKQAVRYLSAQKGRHCYNLIYNVTSPGKMTTEDTATLKKFDAFARQVEIGTSTTVANTIFPLDSYLSRGTDGVFSHYQNHVFPKVTTNWGNYFDRMTRRRGPDGKTLLDRDGAPLNPLKILLEKLKRRVGSGLGTKSHYELAIADEAFELTTYLPERDCNYPRGGPCLSHLSFKLTSNNSLSLTAFYRSHYYVERALGNLLGLARLQAFVSHESGAPIGPLTCIASHAVLESALANANAQQVSKFVAGLQES